MWSQLTDIAKKTTGTFLDSGSDSSGKTLTKKFTTSESKSVALVASAVTAAIFIKLVNMNNVISGIYDTLIVNMTEKWYRSCLSKLEDGSTVLDVGVGTAGALLRCLDLVESKKLKIIGIDYNGFYIKSAEKSIEKANASDRISVYELDLYNEDKVQSLIEKGSIDAVYFSGSFSLLPDPNGALKSILPLLKRDGKVYITQTYQKRSPPLLGFFKPLIKYLTTIDFGRLIKVEEIDSFFESNEDFDLISHDVIEGSVDTYFQAAYMSVLKQKKSMLRFW